MRLLTAVILTLSLTVLVATRHGAVTASTHPQATPSPTPPVSPCTVQFNKVAAPARLTLGATVGITLSAKVMCPVLPLHLVLVLPDTKSVPPAMRQQMMDSAIATIDGLDLPNHPNDAVGVVSYALTAKTQCALTEDAAKVKTCIRQLKFTGSETAIDQGLKEGLKVLQLGRPHGSSADGVQEAMTLYASHSNNTGCTPVLQAAKQVKAAKAMVVAVCVGSDCDEQCMRQTASTARDYFSLDSGPVDLRTLLPATTPELFTITDTLPPTMSLIPNSAVPPPSSGDAANGLTWAAAVVPSGGVTVTFRVRPLVTGSQATNLQATGKLLDSDKAEKSFDFPIPIVMVDAPSPTPTIAPLPTATPTTTARPTLPPTASPTSVPSPAPSVTPPRVAWLIYLPMALRPLGLIHTFSASAPLRMPNSP